MWDSCCSGNTHKTNLWQFTGLHQEALLKKFKEKNIEKGQRFIAANKRKPPLCFYQLATY